MWPLWRVHLHGIAPAWQHSSKETSPFERVIEIYHYFVLIIHRQQRKSKVVSHKMPNDFCTGAQRNVGCEIEAMKEG